MKKTWQQNGLKGVAIGFMIWIPVLLLAEQIRYGFVSNWMPLWYLIVIPLLAWVPLKELRVKGMLRWMLFAEYVTVSLILLQGVLGERLLTVILGMVMAYIWFEIFHLHKTKN